MTEPEREQKEDEKHKSTSKSPKKYVILIHVVFLCAPQQQKNAEILKNGHRNFCKKLAFHRRNKSLFFLLLGKVNEIINCLT